ncbi:MAG: hypothetical protein ACR2OZ_09030 [Verrucomicrobiales bacterium]
MPVPLFSKPLIYNGWEQITQPDRTRDAINIEEVRHSCRKWVRWAVTR